MYDRDGVARLFDSVIDDCRVGIPGIISQIAFEQLDLTNRDVLLDIGTGTGDAALAAAHICRQVIGIDISKSRLEKARLKAVKTGVNNVIFAYGAFEELCAGIDLTVNITKVLAVYSLHHLPDPLKKESLQNLVNLVSPRRIVIGDLMFFEDPALHRDTFDTVWYDGGDTDFPSTVTSLTTWLTQLNAVIHVEKIHPLAGVITADFV